MFRPLLRYGNQGDGVQLLQQALNLAPSQQPRLSVDGIFGGKTHGRVTEFQGQNQLVADGLVGDKTHAALQALYDEVAKLALPTPPGEQAARDRIVNLARTAAQVLGWPESAPPPPDPTSQRIACRIGLGVPVNAKGDQARQGGVALTGIYATAGHPEAAKSLTISEESIKFFKANPNAPPKLKNAHLADWCGVFCLYIYKTAGLKMSPWPLKIRVKEPEMKPVVRIKDIRPGDLCMVSPFGGRNHHFLIADINGFEMKSVDGNAGIHSSIIKRGYSFASTTPDKFGAFQVRTPQGIEPGVFASPIWEKVL